MTDLQIVRAQAADWKRIRSIRLRCLGDAPEAFGSTLAKEQERTDTEWRTRTENERVAHFLAATAYRDDVGIAVCVPSAEHAKTAELVSMWVAP
ncbi:hypothetical protein, partial [Novipirellula maiorica]|uniref:hypothetical protein n=1 Tax=Novipirellula maiorica TaxID=1265734 RepID=UPI0005930C2B